jgi:hypothetical protein
MNQAPSRGSQGHAMDPMSETWAMEMTGQRYRLRSH